MGNQKTDVTLRSIRKIITNAFMMLHHFKHNDMETYYNKLLYKMLFIEYLIDDIYWSLTSIYKVFREILSISSNYNKCIFNCIITFYFFLHITWYAWIIYIINRTVQNILMYFLSYWWKKNLYCVMRLRIELIFWIVCRMYSKL